MLAQIRAPRFTAGIVLSDDVVTEAAPIVKYMIGWSRDRVRSYCKQKQWAVAVVAQKVTTMGDEADADWQDGLVEWGIEETRKIEPGGSRDRCLRCGG